MAKLSGWCKNGHPVETMIMSCDVRRTGEDGVMAVCGEEDVTCEKCGELIEDLEVEE